MKKGFTLVELLAVIVILAVILVIAVPKITDVINSTKMSSIKASHNLIVDAAEKEYTNRVMLGTLDETNNKIKCEDLTNLGSDYSKCTVTFSNGIPFVTLIGAGKFDGLKCSGTKNNTNCETLEPNWNLAINILKATLGETNGMYQDNTTDTNYRYKGADPNNYISFNNEIWRIIGIFNVSNGTTTEERVKIVREPFKDSSGNLITMAFSKIVRTTHTGISKSYGSNDWTISDLNNMFNTYYAGTSSTCTYCLSSETTCSNVCTEIINKLGDTAKNMIDNAVWYLGATSTLSSTDSYADERISGSTTYTAKIGLIYSSDYRYANDDYNNSTCSDIEKTGCSAKNWLFYGNYSNNYYWTISPLKNDDTTSVVVCIDGGTNGGFVGIGTIGTKIVRPTLYLKSNVKIVNGTGTSTDPYILSIN